jgi:hypothetical protein
VIFCHVWEVPEASVADSFAATSARVAGAVPGKPNPDHKKGGDMASGQETGEITGTKDKEYNLIWFTEQSLSNALRLENYIQDAERDGDEDLVTLFRKAQAESRKGGELGKQMLAKRLGS